MDAHRSCKGNKEALKDYKGHAKCTQEVLKGMKGACKGYESCAQRALKSVEGAYNENVRSSEWQAMVYKGTTNM